jgi:phosphoribosylaminoimidazole (AIR) synthetase
MALIVSAEDAPAATALLEDAGETVFSIGKIVSRADGEAAARVL